MTLRPGGPVLGALALLIALTLTSCSDDTDAAPVSDSPSANGSDADQGSASDSDSDSGPGASLGQLGSAIERTVGGVVGYDVDGSTLRVRFDETIRVAELSFVCSLIENLAGSVSLPSDAVVETETDGTVETCDV